MINDGAIFKPEIFSDDSTNRTAQVFLIVHPPRVIRQNKLPFGIVSHTQNEFSLSHLMLLVFNENFEKNNYSVIG